MWKNARTSYRVIIYGLYYSDLWATALYTWPSAGGSRWIRARLFPSLSRAYLRLILLCWPA